MEQVRRCYNEVADRYDNRYTGLRGVYYKQLEEDFVFDLVDCKDKAILDLGTGTGRFAFSVSGRAKFVFGIDISDQILKVAQSKMRDEKNITFCLMSGTNLAFKDDSFDVVLSIGTFEYVEDLTPFLQEARRILKPKGFLIFSVHNKDKIIKLVNNLTYRWYAIAQHDLVPLQSQLARLNFSFSGYHGTFFFSSRLWVWRIYGFFQKLKLESLQRLFINGMIKIQKRLDRFELTRKRAGEFIIAAQNLKEPSKS